jgi:hypothetical protein
MLRRAQNPKPQQHRLLCERPTPTDLQGVWTNDTYTPLERPKQFAGKAFFDASEQAAFALTVAEARREREGAENGKTSADVVWSAIIP